MTVLRHRTYAPHILYVYKHTHRLVSLIPRLLYLIRAQVLLARGAVREMC